MRPFGALLPVRTSSFVCALVVAEMACTFLLRFGTQNAAELRPLSNGQIAYWGSILTGVGFVAMAATAALPLAALMGRRVWLVAPIGLAAHALASVVTVGVFPGDGSSRYAAPWWLLDVEIAGVGLLLLSAPGVRPAAEEHLGVTDFDDRSIHPSSGAVLARAPLFPGPRVESFPRLGASAMVVVGVVGTLVGAVAMYWGPPVLCHGGYCEPPPGTSVGQLGVLIGAALFPLMATALRRLWWAAPVGAAVFSVMAYLIALWPSTAVSLGVVAYMGAAVVWTLLWAGMFLVLRIGPPAAARFGAKDRMLG